MTDIEKAIETLKDMKSYFNDRSHRQYSMPAIDTAISTLEKQLTNGWIPISERLPEKSDIYLATFLEEGKKYVERFYYSPLMGDEGIENIIAWQPLPEPWKGDKEE